jgi:hypothetical protein
MRCPLRRVAGAKESYRTSMHMFFLFLSHFFPIALHGLQMPTAAINQRLSIGHTPPSPQEIHGVVSTHPTAHLSIPSYQLTLRKEMPDSPHPCHRHLLLRSIIPRDSCLPPLFVLEYKTSPSHLCSVLLSLCISLPCYRVPISHAVITALLDRL